jgi:hypothetical protein
MVVKEKSVVNSQEKTPVVSNANWPSSSLKMNSFAGVSCKFKDIKMTIILKLLIFIVDHQVLAWLSHKVHRWSRVRFEGAPVRFDHILPEQVEYVTVKNEFKI